MNQDYVFQNMITYIGNKRALLPYIEETVISIKQSLLFINMSVAELLFGKVSITNLLLTIDSLLPMKS